MQPAFSSLSARRWRSRKEDSSEPICQKPLAAPNQNSTCSIGIPDHLQEYLLNKVQTSFCFGLAPLPVRLASWQPLAAPCWQPDSRKLLACESGRLRTGWSGPFEPNLMLRQHHAAMDDKKPRKLKSFN